MPFARTCRPSESCARGSGEMAMHATHPGTRLALYAYRERDGLQAESLVDGSLYVGRFDGGQNQRMGMAFSVTEMVSRESKHGHTQCLLFMFALAAGRFAASGWRGDMREGDGCLLETDGHIYPGPFRVR